MKPENKLVKLESRMSMLEQKIDMIINLLLSELYDDMSGQVDEEELGLVGLDKENFRFKIN
ncbi:MAG: hypothetical protein GOU99_01940 [Candidatus Altiarchaeota archaeon]|nr:hypothetical protein [Candidatus Altiarchaeota archaeon]